MPVRRLRAARTGSRFQLLHFAMRSCDRLVPILLKIVPICEDEVTRKNLSDVLAQFCRSVEVGSPPVFTWIVDTVMPAAFTLAQVIDWRASIDAWSEYQRSCVFRPSVSRIMT